MRTSLCLTLILIAFLALVAPSSRGAQDEPPPTTQPTTAGLWELIAKELGRKGELKDNVYTISLVRMRSIGRENRAWRRRRDRSNGTEC